MKLFATVTALAALLGTASLADNNEIFVAQSGNNNNTGTAADPLEQVGTQNLIDVTQSGNENTVAKARQAGAQHDMNVVQSGNRNLFQNVRQRGGYNNEMVIRQSGNDNRIVNANQFGNSNLLDVRQGGNDNYGHSLQKGDQNTMVVRTNGHRNEYRMAQGSFNANDCTGCDIELTQGGNDNLANVYQMDLNQMASISQSGNGNTVYTSQSAN